MPRRLRMDKIVKSSTYPYVQTRFGIHTRNRRQAGFLFHEVDTQSIRFLFALWFNFAFAPVSCST